MSNFSRKALIKNAIWSIIAILLNCAINFSVVPYVSEKIGIEAYGFVALANTFIMYIDVISVALNAFVGRFIAVEFYGNNILNSNRYFTSAFIANIIFALVIFSVGIIFIINAESYINIPGEINFDVKILFFLVLLRYILVLLRNVFEVVTFIVNRIDLAEKVRCISYLFQAIILLLLCNLFKPYVWYVGLAAAASAIILFIAQLYFWRLLLPKLKLHFTLFSIKCVRDFITNGIWNSLNNVGNLLNTGIDLIITNRMLSNLIMGQISVGKSVGTLCYSLVVAVSNSFKPKQLKFYAENDIDMLVKELKKSMTITGSICGLIFSGFSVCGLEFLDLWIPSQDNETIFRIVCIVLFGDIITGVVNPLYYVFTLTKKLKIPCIITICMGIVNVISKYIIIVNFDEFAVYGVVLTTAIINCVHFIDTPIYSSYCLKIKFSTFYPVVIKHLIITFVLLLSMNILNLWFPNVESWLSLIIKIVIFLFLGLVIVYYMLYKNENKYL